MNIQPLEPGKLKISLTKIDLVGMGLTYEKINYDDPHTRKILWGLLLSSGEAEHFDGNDKLLIEVFPAPENGCLIYFTAEAPPKTSIARSRLRLKKAEPENVYIYTFEDSGNLTDMALAVGNLRKNDDLMPESKLFLIDGRYSFVVYGKIKTGVAHILNEFSSVKSVADKKYLKLNEYGDCLIKNNAFDVLCKHFAKTN